jgi:hypothetical protein
VLTQTNSFYRIKLIEMQQIIALSSHFAAFLFNIIGYTRKKGNYYKGGTLNIEAKVKAKNRFKTVSIAVLFI